MRAVNLLPREPKRTRKAPERRRAARGPGALRGRALLAAGYLLASAKVNDRKATLQALRDELASLPAPPPQPQVSPELVALRDQRIAALSSALQTRLAWDRILRQISAVLPGDVWLTTLSAQQISPPPVTSTTSSTTTSSTTTTSTTPTPAPAAPVPPPTAGPLNVAGYTYSPEGVARLLTRLAVVPALQDVQLVSSSQTVVSGRQVFAFTIKADVRAGETG